MNLKGQVSIKRCQNFLVKEDIDDDNVQVVDKGSKFGAFLIVVLLINVCIDVC